jgi:hypothetical protein
MIYEDSQKILLISKLLDYYLDVPFEEQEDYFYYLNKISSESIYWITKVSYFSNMLLTNILIGDFHGVLDFY